MLLITVDDLEVALGETIDPSDEAQAEYFIRLISTYIETYTGKNFSIQSDTVRLRSDYYGIIELPGGPVVEVEAVKPFVGGSSVDYRWDGNVTIFNLTPNTVLDVTYTYGYEEVPEDIQMVCTEAVKKLWLSPDGQEEGPKIRRKVGDVEEMYQVGFNIGMAGGLFNDLEVLILDDYRTRFRTMHQGFALPDVDMDKIPSSDSALYE